MSSQGIEILLSLMTALGAGLLIGAERQQGDRRAIFAGIRTFPLFALAGALGMLIGPWLLIALGAGVGGVITMAYFRSTFGRVRIGTSTEMAALVTFGLGALCTARDLPLALRDRLLLVVAGATMVMGLLSIKRPLERFLKSVSVEDVYATAKLLLLAAILLPTLPNRPMGPWDALNPRQIGILVVLVSAIGFAGYVAIRSAGPARGLGLTGLFGGLASSTAVTLSFAGKAKYAPRLVNPCALAITLASSTMFPRMLVYLSAVSPKLAQATIIPFASAAVTGFLASAILHFRSGKQLSERDSQPPESLQFTNPFSLSSAFKFAIVFTLISLVCHAASITFKESGTYFAALIAGTANVDAITLSIAKQHQRGLLRASVAVDALGLAALSSTVIKVAFAGILGGSRLGWRVGLALGAAIVVGFAVRMVLLSGMH